MAIKITVAQAHGSQLKDPEILREIDSIEKGVNALNPNYIDGTVNFMFIKGIYNHSERNMITACILINKTGCPICEIHGELALEFANENAKIAKTILDFDEPFLGKLMPDNALLVHIGIPVMGLEHDDDFGFQDIRGNFDNVRITYADE